MAVDKELQANKAQKANAKRVQCLDDINNSDFTAERNEYHFRTPFLVDKLSVLLKDQRDLPMLCLLLNILEALTFGVSFVYGINLWQPQLSLLARNLVGLGYLVSLVLLFQERFTLCMHFSSHRSIFHSRLLNQSIVYLIAPFFGVPPGLYHIHHVLMHHIENNHGLDASSTEDFQRDSVVDFFRYWFRFVIGIYRDLVRFTVGTKRISHTVTLAICLAIWLSCIFMLAKYVSLVATLWVFVIPHIFSMSVMSFGNWSQHIFVNPEDCLSNFGLTYNCMDTPQNQTTFNDGYHIVHHLNARLHWTELPQYFYDTRERHLKSGALTFRGVHFFDVGALVMTGQLQKLAEKYYVHLGTKDTAPTTDEVVEKLRTWLKPVSKSAQQQKAKSS